MCDVYVRVRTAHVAVLTLFFKCNNNSSVNRNRNKTRITCSLWLSCLVLSQIVCESYGKVKSAQRNEEQQQEEKSNWCIKSVSKAKRRRERKSDRVHNSAHRAEESRWQEWVGNRVSNATWLLVCCVAVDCLSLCFFQLIEWVNRNPIGNLSNEKKWAKCTCKYTWLSKQSRTKKANAK